MKRFVTAQLLAMLRLFGTEETKAIENKVEKKKKPCLECGKEHDHNNSWCSAECARLWKARKRLGR